MPFELGLDIGCQSFKGGRWQGKKCLILEVERYRYQAAISDLSNSDIASHKANPATLVFEVRNWLDAQAGLHAPGPTKVWANFNDFMAWNYDKLKERHYSDQDIERLPVPDLIKCIKQWCAANPWK